MSVQIHGSLQNQIIFGAFNFINSCLLIQFDKKYYLFRIIKQTKAKMSSGGEDNIDYEMDGMSGNEAAPKKVKGAKGPKGEKKKSKGWKENGDDLGEEPDAANKTQQPLSGAENGQLKLNVNPTEVETKSQGENKEEAKNGEGEEKNDEEKKADGEGSDGKASEKSDGSKKDGAGSQGEKATGKKLPPVQSFAEKRAMDRIFLTKETREFKEKLLDQVNEIVVRQNGADPIANMETFAAENASRKVLKELLNEFHVTAAELSKKTAGNEDKIRALKTKAEKQELVMKKLTGQCASVETFNKRMQTVEQNIESIKDAAEKRHESTRDYIARVKETLEGRVDQVTQFNEKLNSMSDEIQRIRGMSEASAERTLAEVMKGLDAARDTQEGLALLSQRTQQAHSQAEYERKVAKEQMAKNAEEFAALKVDVEGRMNEVTLDLQRRCYVDDMAQNFKRLNDILVVKFKQLEDTKQACRNLITYQKFYHPIQTQQQISENLLQLKASKGDAGFVVFQKNLYEGIIEATRSRKKEAATLDDIDLTEHLEMLEKKSMMLAGWSTVPPTDQTPGTDFITPLMEAYLEDIRVRSKEDQFGEPTASILLRKTVKLQAIDGIIDELAAKTTALKSETEAYADFLAEEARLKEIADTTRKLTKRKLDYAPRVTYKRDNSYKGRNREALIPIDEQEDFRDELETKFPRPISRQPERRDKLRRVQREADMNFDDGIQKGGIESVLSQTQGSDLGDGEVSKDGQTPTGGGMLEVGGGGIGGMGGGMGGMGGTGGGMGGGPGGGMGMPGGGFGPQEKAAFAAELKAVIKPVIIEVAEAKAEAAVTNLRKRTDAYEAANEKEKKNIVWKFEGEMLRVSEHLKDQLSQLNTDFTDNIKNVNKLRTRDKSDNDRVVQDHANHIQEHRIDIDRHQTYFDTLAQSIALIAENINMQMEGEHADLFDRKMMALYGAKPGKASMADVTTKLDSKVRSKPYRVEASKSPTVADFDGRIPEQSSQLTKGKSGNNMNSHQYIAEDESGDGSGGEGVEAYMQDNTTKIGSMASGSVRRITSAGIHEIQYDDIRQTSGANVKRNDLPIAINQNCLSHQNKADSDLTIKLFKLACLAYKPSEVSYRGSTISRIQLIEMRRQLIDRVSNILPGCDLFKNNAFYPKRYFDDLMVEEKGYLEHFVGQQSRADFKTLQQSRLSQLMLQASSTQVGSEARFMGTGRQLNYSPTHQMPLNSQSSNTNFHLPDLVKSKNAASRAFGFGHKGNMDAISDVQQQYGGRTRNNQSVTLDVDAEITKTSFGYMAQSQLKGMYSTKNRDERNTDIKRNASVAVVDNRHAPKLFNSSRKNFTNLDYMGSTIEKETTQSHRGLGSQLGASGPKIFVEGISKSPSNAAIMQSHAQLSNMKGRGQTLEFHRRNNSTIDKDFKIDLHKGKASQHRPSVAMAPALQMGKPKVSFDLPTARN